MHSKSSAVLPSKFLLALLLLLSMGVAALFGGCKKSDGYGPPKEVRLGYFANLTHAQAVLGVSSGEYATAVAPSKLTTRVFNAGPSLIEALFANEIDIGYIGPGPALNGFGKSKGKGLRVISGAAANGVLIVARKNSGIKRLQDLAGKKIATPQFGNTQDIAAKHYFLSELKQKDVNNVIAVPNAEQAGMMQRGAIDAAWAPEPWGTLLIRNGATLVGQEKDLWEGKQFAIAVVITTPEFLARHPDVVEKFLAAHRVWTARLSADSARYVPELEAALARLTGKGLPPGVAKDALANTQFTDDPIEQTFKVFARWSLEVGVAQQVTDTTGLIDTTILRKLESGGPPAAGPPTAASASTSAPAKEPAAPNASR